MLFGVSTWNPATGNGGGGSGVQQLRVVAVDNRVNNGAENPGYTNCITRWPYLIGSGDVNGIVMSSESSFNAGGTLVTNFTVVKKSLEYNGATAPFTYSGLRSKTINAGDHDIQTDVLMPSAFGLSKFPLGALVWVTTELTVPSTTAVIPVTGNNVGQVANSTVRWYNPATYTISNGVDSTGPVVGTGTGTTTRSNGYHPIMLGYYVSGDPKTLFGAGDSIDFGQGDVINSTVPNGYGGFARSQVDADGVSNPISGLNFNRTANSTDDMITNYPWMQLYMKYARILVEEYAANDFGQAGTGKTPAQLQANLITIWNYFKAANPGNWQIVRPPIFPRTSSTDAWLTVANQTYNPLYDTNSPAMQTWFQARVADGTITMVLSPSATITALPSDPWKWIVDGSTPNYGTTDGTHPSSRIHIAIGAWMRAAYATLL